MAYNSVLKTTSEVILAKKRLKEMNLFPHHGVEKCWDTCKIIEFINMGDRQSAILDVGCNGSPILVMLNRLGFTKLYGCDFVLKPKYNPTLMRIVCQFYKREYLPVLEMYHSNAYNLSVQNLQKTNYADNMFEYVTSLSVIEHGVNIENYFREMARVLKKGGCLLTSTDYWPEKITNTKAIISNERPDNVFSRSEIESAVKIAEKYRLKLTEPIDYSYEEKVASWKKTGLKFTFIFFTLRKE